MENIKFYKKDTFWGIVFLGGFMIIQLSITDIFQDGEAPGIWIGILIGSLIGALARQSFKIEGIYLPILMIGNYILFKYSIYIPSYIVFFIGFSSFLIYSLNKEESKYKLYKISLIVILIVGFFTLNYYMHSDNILKDRGFYRYVKKEYKIKEKIEKRDLEGIEKLILDGNDYGINTLEGIEYFKDIKDLRIWDGYTINDFKPLSKLYNLKHLILWYVNLDKIEKIDTMKSLEWIEIIYPKGGKLDNLENFPNLKKLEIQGIMYFEDLTVLKGPINLEKLSLADGQVIRFDGIEQFPHLKELHLYELYISDINKIFTLKELEKIEIENCNIYNRDDFEKIAKERGIKIEEIKPIEISK